MEAYNIDLAKLEIGGWNKILKGNNLFPNKDGYNILIKGLPGTGKTTLGLSILNKLCNDNEKARLVTFVEPAKQLLNLMSLLSLNFKNNIDVFEMNITEMAYTELDKLTFLKDSQKLLYLMIDGVSILKYQSQALQTRTKNLIDKLRSSGLSTILISEEGAEGEDRFFEYLVDGIINLTAEGPDRKRFLEIKKLRFVDFIPGKHAFEFKKNPKKGNIELSIYPSVNCYSEDKVSSINFKRINSGIEGFDKLVKYHPDAAFDSGDTILIMGEPGSGKNIFCLEFMNGLLKDNNEIGLWVSLKNDYKTFKKYTENFTKNGKHLFGDLINSDRFKFIYFNPSNFILDEFSSVIITILKENNVSRLVIDSLSVLERKFSSQKECIEYLTAFLGIIKKAKPVTMMSYGILKYFQPLGNLEITYNPCADIVIHLRHFDENNALIRGFEILKFKDKDFNSLLQNVEISKDKGLSINEKGWTKVGLLSGNPQEIAEARLFFKYFYQNNSTTAIDNYIFNNFKGRYSDRETFRMVAKTHPSPDHWSFKGFGGPGHSNTKVVCLKKYIMDRLRDNKVFLDIPDDVSGDNIIKKQFESRILYTDIDRSKMVPIYADLGVLCCQDKQFNTLFKEEPLPNLWDELIALSKKVKNIKKYQNKYFFVMPSLATDLANFMGFFLEILWSHGGDLFIPQANENTKDSLLEGFKKGIMSHQFINTLEFLIKLISEKVCPNPRIGAHYQNSIFSRRWYSKINTYEKLNEEGDEIQNDKSSIQFSIAPLPAIDKDLGSYSALEIYCAGIIKGSVAPETGWMFIKELVGYETDNLRIEHRRGIPMDEKLCLSQKENIEQEADFEKIRKLLGFRQKNSISGIQRNIKRNTDIPFYYDIEQIIAPKIEKIFISNKTKYLVHCQMDIMKNIEDFLNKRFLDKEQNKR